MAPIVPRIAIIGAGLSGLSLALALEAQGITCTLYELREQSFNEGGGLTLTPNALKILDILGLYDTIRTDGYQFDKIVVKTESNLKITEYFLGNEELFGYDALRINRQILLKTLRKEVQRRGISIEYGRKFSRVLAEDDCGVTFKFEDGSIETAALLIGADGIHSKVRRYIHPRAQPVYTGIMALISSVDRSAFCPPSVKDGDNDLPCFIAGKRGAFIALPQSPDGKTIAVLSHKQFPETDKSGWDSLRASPQRMMKMQRQHIDDSSDLLQSVIGNIQPEYISPWPYSYMPRLDTWTSSAKRVILLGDAAHAIPPSSGQGAAQAFEDAYSLSILLSNLGPQAKFEAAIDWWQGYRMERTKLVLDLTQILNDKRLPRAKQRNPEGDWVGRQEGNEIEQQGWLYMPKVREETVAWIESQGGTIYSNL